MTCNWFKNRKIAVNLITSHSKSTHFLIKLLERYILVPKGEHLADNDQTILTKARSTLKQYNPKKPPRWGYKVFIRSEVSSFSYDFDFFSGTTKLQLH